MGAARTSAGGSRMRQHSYTADFKSLNSRHCSRAVTVWRRALVFVRSVPKMSTVPHCKSPYQHRHGLGR
jgi:hypothetical protein